MDRSFRGLIAGVVAGVAQNIWNLADYYFFQITELRFIDWVSALLTLAKPQSIPETITALLLQIIIWDGFLGVIFAHLVTKITSQGVIIKSTFYSVLLWFFFKVVVVLFRVPILAPPQPFPGRMSNLFAVIIWGILLGIILKKLDPTLDKDRQENTRS